MIFYISLSDAQKITQQQSIRSVARELSLRYAILHYDEAVGMADAVIWVMAATDFLEGTTRVKYELMSHL